MPTPDKFAAKLDDFMDKGMLALFVERQSLRPVCRPRLEGLESRA